MSIPIASELDKKADVREKRRVKLLIVDDSIVIRRGISNLFDGSERIRVIGEAENGKVALDQVPRLDPDVVTLDINMPVLDGLSTLKHMMIKSPKPVIMFSTLTKDGAVETFDALRYGAVDFMHKPSRVGQNGYLNYRAELIEKLMLAADVRMQQVRLLRTASHMKDAKTTENQSCEEVFTLGAAEGGYAALLRIIPQLDADIPAAVLVVLYTDDRFLDPFVAYLNTYSKIKVKKAVDGDQICGGVCYLTSGMQYMTIGSGPDGRFLRVHPNPFPKRAGAISMMMLSVAENYTERAVGIILSGTGTDGTEGLREIIRMGGMAMIQDPKSCLYRDMPKAAMAGANAAVVISDLKIADEMNRFFSA